MTHDDLPDPPPNTHWLNPDDTIRENDYCVDRGIYRSVSLHLVGQEAGDPIPLTGGWLYFCRHVGFD